MSHNLSIEQLEAEIEKIAAYIAEAKIEIASISLPEDKTGNEKNIAHAASQLTEVVRHTEEATNTIMDKSDAIMLLAGEITDADISAKLSEHALGILEACSFQDITGQRITKVVRALKHIEEKVDALVAAFGDEIAKYKKAHPDAEEPAAEEQKPSDASLLNGPQLPDDASKQAEIDALLASFD